MHPIFFVVDFYQDDDAHSVVFMQQNPAKTNSDKLCIQALFVTFNGKQRLPTAFGKGVALLMMTRMLYTAFG